jgi:hypothetical protein
LEKIKSNYNWNEWMICWEFKSNISNYV